MKSILPLALVLSAVMFPLGAAFAADSSPTPEEIAWEQKAFDYRLNFLTDKLNLTSDQQTALKPILKKELDEEIELHQKSRHKIEALLTPAQKATFDSLAHNHPHSS